MGEQWENHGTRLRAATAFIDQAIETLPLSEYTQFIRLICTMYTVTPISFRAKLKFVYRNHQHLLPALNPFLPDEYQFSREELRHEDRGYESLEIYRPCIKFLNNFKNEVPSETLRGFYELVKSHQRMEIDGMVLYEKAYDLLRGDFDFMKQISEVLGNPMTGGCSMTPSYIGLPRHMQRKVCSSDSEVLNYTLRINDISNGGYQEKTSEELYDVDKVIKSCLQPCHSKGTSIACQNRRFELHNLKYRLMIAEKTLNKVLHKIMCGEINEASALREHLHSEKVMARLRLVKRMMNGNLENLISAPLDSFPSYLDQLSRRKEQVARALLQYDRKHKH